MRPEKDQIKRRRRIGFGGHEKERKGRKEKSEFVEGVSIFSTGRSLEE